MFHALLLFPPLYISPQPFSPPHHHLHNSHTHLQHHNHHFFSSSSPKTHPLPKTPPQAPLMANPAAESTNHLTHLLFFATLLILVSSSSARLLSHVPATEPDLNLALPGENPVAGLPSEKERVVPCNMETGERPEMGRFQPLRLGGGRNKYGPLILSMLPKGSVPSSGPSKRINGLKN